MDFFQQLASSPPGSYSIHSFEKNLAASYAKIQKIVTELHGDLKKMTGYSLVDSRGKLTLNDQLPTLDRYRQYLVEHSLLIRVLEYSLTHPKKNIHDFCQENFLSRATVFRRLVPMEKILAPYHIYFQPSKLTLTGSEQSIRYFLCNVLWYLSSGEFARVVAGFPQLAQLAHQFSRTFPLSTQWSMDEKLTMALVISHLRREAGFYVAELLPAAEILLPQAVQDTWQEQLSPFLNNTPERFFLSELRFSCFLIYSGAIYTDLAADNFNYLQQWRTGNTLQEKVVAEFSKSMVANLFYGQEPANFPLICANFLGMFNTAFLLNDTPPTLSTFVGGYLENPATAFSDLLYFCQRFFQKIVRRKELNFLAAAVPSLAKNFAYCLWPTYYSFLQTKKIKVSLLLDANFNLSQAVEQFLNSLPFVEIVPQRNQCDLLIVQHAFLVPEDYNGPLYVYNYTSIGEDFSHLEETLDKLHQQSLS
ncbi:helix-turn-helix domain-containing protein [Enterococcus timonensis]|uniref:helix-turn-helix domain-containing protein n=1 Tax=Enterococcus timonensis TaxID=1852364 RepID=UPI001319FC0F|nr:helix-turn-helix domain-containing protein [Enterococcus timonensis]